MEFVLQCTYWMNGKSKLRNYYAYLNQISINSGDIPEDCQRAKTTVVSVSSTATAPSIPAMYLISLDIAILVPRCHKH